MIGKIDHVNIVVSDLERMVKFYTEILGLKETKRVAISGDWVASVVGLGQVNADVVYLELKSGPRIELIRYNTPTMGRPADVDKPHAPGIRHIAFTVDDIDGLFSRLRDRDVRFFSNVQTVPSSQVTYANDVRKRLVYFQDPEGNLLELCEYR